MPKIVDHAQRRLDLADAALALVASEGVAAVTTRLVAKKRGWTIGVINHYFKSRHDLLLAALRRPGEIPGKVHEDLDEQNLDAMEKLRRLVKSFLPLDERRLALTRIFLFFYAEGAAEETARTEIAGFLARWRSVVPQPWPQPRNGA
ncbi:AcrR family transcriptional regulator [Paenarthrobacter nicotinovorans]|jgi:AcrR family transcriptional regulator|uniref:AcrR family transcriptional regulator n=1 Tax=Paenarthrobacter nicotinovorans TaxID=29320 RepID=A0ABT9TRC3_PAENI|nr:TetR/AcrR family transcriptional regulator [Paenarthrobacter nicotinovorans]MDQ0103097.1 AcrR family transcriptional regulator [Paenarthrobacter nicotinovorans]GAT88424.1 TetR family transcriptional regulator [Paenarthrobacter nicotinovorans]